MFDTIVNILEKMIESGEIDSIRLTNTLWKLIATLKRNKTGSYFSVRSTWDFLRSLLKNYLWEQLSEIPGIGAFVKALKTTIEDLDKEMALLHGQMSQEMHAQYQANFPFLEYQSQRALPEVLPESADED